MTGTIFDIKELAVHDGPGIRVTAFLKGCPLRCLWCHNPEGLSAKPQLMYKSSRCLSCGKCFEPCSHAECQPFGRCLHACPEGLLSVSGEEIDSASLAEKLYESGSILGDAFGGVTFSGGEPLMQHEFLLATISELKKKNVHTCIETSGYAEADVFLKVLDAVDYVIMDIKLADSKLHKKYTGVGNEKILANFKALQESGKPYEIRTPLIPNITDTDENLSAIKTLIGDSVWEKLPYNAMAGAKYKMLGMEYPLDKK